MIVIKWVYRIILPYGLCDTARGPASAMPHCPSCKERPQLKSIVRVELAASFLAVQPSASCDHLEGRDREEVDKQQNYVWLGRDAGERDWRAQARDIFFFKGQRWREVSGGRRTLRPHCLDAEGFSHSHMMATLGGKEESSFHASECLVRSWPEKEDSRSHSRPAVPQGEVKSRNRKSRPHMATGSP